MAKSKARTGAVEKPSAKTVPAPESTPEPSCWKIELTHTCRELLLGIQDTRVRKKIAERIDGLHQDPDKQGKELHGELKGYRSLRAVGQRYRIVYRLDHGKVIVLIVSLGIRKEGDREDVYSLTKKLLKLGLLSD